MNESPRHNSDEPSDETRTPEEPGLEPAADNEPPAESGMDSGAVDSGAVQTAAVDSGAVHAGAVHAGDVHAGAVQTAAVGSGDVHSDTNVDGTDSTDDEVPPEVTADSVPEPPAAETDSSPVEVDTEETAVIEASTTEPEPAATTEPEPEPAPAPPDPEDPEQIWRRLGQGRDRLLAELRKVIVGQDKVVEELIIVLFSGGHCLLSGAPGLAKTLLIRTLAQIMDLDFKRIQFTPDLMPADITGTEIIDEDMGTGHRSLRFIRGPIFANVVLADEINRTPPKTQSALLEAMEEKQVTVAGDTYDLAPPFFVFATQNPIELEGTYPLPEAQLDRFMFKVLVEYLDEEQELAVATRTTSGVKTEVKPVFNAEDMLRFARLVRSVPIAEAVARYAVRLVQASRPDRDDAPEFIGKYVGWGAGTRASQYLILAAKARALLAGRFHVACEDIRAVAHPVLRHRILTNFQADADRVDVESIIDQLLQAVAEPTSGLTN